MTLYLICNVILILSAIFVPFIMFSIYGKEVELKFKNAWKVIPLMYLDFYLGIIPVFASIFSAFFIPILCIHDIIVLLCNKNEELRMGVNIVFWFCCSFVFLIVRIAFIIKKLK